MREQGSSPGLAAELTDAVATRSGRYTGTALPAIGIGAVAQAITPPAAVAIFAGIVIGICLAGLAGLTTESPQPPGPQQAQGDAGLFGLQPGRKIQR